MSSVIISAILTALAFPKFDLPYLAWFSLSILFISIGRSKTPKDGTKIGFLFGLIFFGFILFWITSLYEYVGFFAYIGWIFLVIFQSLFIALFGYIVKRFNLSHTLYEPVIWVLLEVIRGLGFLGLTSGIIGLSQANNTTVIQISSFYSIYGVSFILVLANSSIAALFAGSLKKNIKRSRYLLLVSLLAIFGSLLFGFNTMANKEEASSSNKMRIAIIQPNIPQEKKLDSRYVTEIFDKHYKLSLSAIKEKPNLIIWPETVILSYLENDDKFLKRVKELAIRSHAYLLIGTPYSEEGLSYNSVIAVSPSGKVFARYDKHHLVPFGEYLPFRRVTYPILAQTHFFDGEFSEGVKQLPINIKDRSFGLMICFESAFPSIAKNMKNKGAEILVTVTNDAWIVYSCLPYAHINHAIFRAVENRKYFIQVANSGISALITPYGEVKKSLGVGKSGYLVFDL